MTKMNWEHARTHFMKGKSASAKKSSKKAAASAAKKMAKAAVAIEKHKKSSRKVKEKDILEMAAGLGELAAAEEKVREEHRSRGARLHEEAARRRMTWPTGSTVHHQGGRRSVWAGHPGLGQRRVRP